MNKRVEAVKRAKKLAKQFLRDVKELEEINFISGKEYATVKRRSMDLTNELANLRKSPYS